MTTGKGVKALCVTVHWHPVNCNPVLENDREDVLSNILWKWSPETYLTKERTLKPEQDLYDPFNAQASSLGRRMYKEHGAGVQELFALDFLTQYFR